ncbi:hypothetical protein [Delftia lacustris]|uniref:hypothetical protein n=1 Tax=Delftia lacustris TaxID=558537 RepID=UPI001FCAF142|nr:hypothetical protein [Delftia lacustris]
MIEILGTVSDYKVAEIFGIGRRTVGAERKNRGIPSFCKHNRVNIWNGGIFWTPQMIEKLGRAPDRVVARELGLSNRTVGKKRRALGIAPALVWGDEQVALLGVVPDKAVAEILGTTKGRAAAARRYRGIRPAMEQKTQEVPKEEVKRVRTEKNDLSSGLLAQLGQVADSVIAREAGVHLSTIAKLRKKYGIKATKQRRPWLPEEVALLGKLSDAEVARRTGRNKAGVTLERTNRRIRGIDPKLAPTLNRLAKEGKI